MSKIIKKQIIYKNNKNFIFPFSFNARNVNDFPFTPYFLNNNKRKLTIAMTGATGLLGSNLLFEIIKQNIDNLDNLEIILFGRSQRNISYKLRISNMLSDECFYYLGINYNEYLFKKILSSIIIIESNFLVNNIIDKYDLNILQEKSIDYFFHIAAYTDFRSTPIVSKKLYEVNVNGTKQLLYLINSLKINQFIYTGSAYCVGYNVGKISPDYFSNSISYRNSYEESKMQAEQLIMSFCKKNRIVYKIFRLTGICGRLLEQPKGYINKYDIFYGLAQFFLKYKYYLLKDINKLYTQEIKIPLRIQANIHSGMNIIPADYAAKMLYQIPIKNKYSGNYHLVNDIDIPYKLMIDTVLNSLKIKGYKIVSNEPKNKNRFEDFYYRTVGKIFTPYAVGNNIIYENDDVNKIAKELNIQIPKMTIDNFKLLINYAKNDYFGIFKEKNIKDPCFVTNNKDTNKQKVMIKS
jgi:nucleoside-diphosphate-sugar epimerase